MKTLAPIVLFTYNRLWHTQKTIESLKNNLLAGDSELIIYSDSYKTESDKEKVCEVRSYLKTINGFRNVTVVESEKNKGLAESVINGVSEILNKRDRIIVLEDDLLLSPWFLTFMNDALETYKEELKVGNIHGHVFNIPHFEKNTFFIKHADSWGWGTWARAWKYFNHDGAQLLSEIVRKKLCRSFDFDGAYKFTRMLERQVNGENDSWAIRWKASLFLNDLYSLNAGKSLVKNIGSDGTGTHSGKLDLFPTVLYQEKLIVSKQVVEESVEARKKIRKIYKWNNSKLHKAIVLCKYIVNVFSGLLNKK